MNKRLLSASLVLVMALTALSMTVYAADGPDYQTALIAQLEAGAKPSANNLFLGLKQWKEMEEGPEKDRLFMRYAAIEKLDLSDMGLKSDDLSMLEPFLGLEELDLSTRASAPDASKNTLTNLDDLQNFFYLRRLDVSGNQLETKGGISGLADCTRLEVLDLSGNKRLFGSAGDAMDVLAELSRVRELDLRGTALSDSDLESVQAMESLRILDISNTSVKNLDLSDMAQLTSLTAENLTLDSLKLPDDLGELDLANTKLKVKPQNEDDALIAISRYGDSGLKLVKSGRASQEVHTVTVAEPAHGTVTTKVKTAAQGDKVSISVTPNKGWALDSVAVSYQNAEGERTPVAVTDGEFTMPEGNVTVTVVFMPLNIEIEYNEDDKGSVSFDKESPARGERVSFVTKLNRGFKVREITAKIGSKPVPVYRDSDGTYCFDMPRLAEDETLSFAVTIVETVTPRYTKSGSFGGQLTFTGLVEGQQYVCQMSEAGADEESAAYTIVTFTARDTTEQLDVRDSAGGYIVSLWKYDDQAASAQDLINVFYEVLVR